MNIGFIIFGYPPEVIGGAELQAMKLAQKMSKYHKITVFAGSKSNEIINENENLKVIKIKYKNIKILRLFLAQLISFMPYIKSEAAKLDVLICYQVNPSGIIGAFSKLMFKIPLVTWIRAETEYKSVLRKLVFTPLLIKYSDKFIVQTNGIKEKLINLYSNKLFFNKDQLEAIKVVPNAVDIRNSPKIPYKDRSGILYVGRLHKNKGVKYLIRIMKWIRERLIIIGEGDERNKLMKESKGLDIEYLGNLSQEKVLKCMERTKLLVLPSIADGLPNVILEAMSVGCPVISTKAGGIPDILEHGKVGYLVEPKDLAELRNFIRILLKNEKLWTEMHNNCLLEAKKYSWNKVEKDVEKILNDI